MAHVEQAIRVLVEKGNADLSICDEAGFQPLHTAVSVGDLKTAETLLSLGASITAGVAKNGNSPCHVAAREGFIDVLQMLLDKGGEKVLSAKNDAQEVALHRAAAHGQREAAAVLIKAGADVNSKDANGDTPLHLAAMFGMEETAGELIALGATVDAIDEDEQTPLHLAVEAREQSAACALVRHGASCELKNEEGYALFSLSFPISLHGKTNLAVMYPFTHSNSLRISFPPSPRLCFPFHRKSPRDIAAGHGLDEVLEAMTTAS